MDIDVFIKSFHQAFGDYELPVALWYSQQPEGALEKTRGCFIKDLKPAREGAIISLNSDTISCPGGKVYSGFLAMPPTLPKFVSEKEHYKETPELVDDFVRDLNIPYKNGMYLNFASIASIQNFDKLEGLVFFATPDVLTGLVSWAQFDNNHPDAISVPFGSGCSSVVAQTIVENQNNGQRVFLGMFDPSARPQVEANILSLSIPMSRFKKMYYTFNDSCLCGARAWLKVKERIESNIF